MTQIQNTTPMPGALGGLGANNPAYAGRKDGASTDFSRLLSQSNQQLQNQSAQSAKTTMAQLQSQQLASQQAQSQQQARQLEAQQQAQRQESAQPPKPASPPPRAPENTAAKDENKLAARNAAARNSANKAEDSKTPSRATKADPSNDAQAPDAADAADAADRRDTVRADAASGKDAERVDAKESDGKDKKDAKDAKDAGATASEQILAMLRGDTPAEIRSARHAGTGATEGDEAGTDALPGGAHAHGKPATTGDALRERQQLQRELSQAAAGTAGAADVTDGSDKAARTDALQAASGGAHEIAMGEGAAKGPQPSFEALLAAAQQTGSASGTSGADGTSATQAPSVPLSQPLDSPDFAPELSASVSLLIQDGVHEAQLQLNPTEMGPVSINIQLDGQQAQVNFHAQHAATREVLERSLPDLAAALQAQGLTLSGGGVFAQSQSNGGQNRGDGSADGASSGHGRRGGRGQGSDDDGAITASGRSERRSAPRGLVDLYA